MGTFGGKQPGSGRPKGASSKKTQELITKATEGGLTPLEYMMRVMRDESQESSRRDSMASAAAPYIHPKLSSVNATVSIKDHEKALADLK